MEKKKQITNSCKDVGVVSKKTTTKFKISPKELRDIDKDYQFDTSDILTYDDETKNILDKFNNNLTTPEKIIMKLYAEFHSARKVAQLLNVSNTTIGKCLKSIRNKILTNDTNP